jgi:hypothetical protein
MSAHRAETPIEDARFDKANERKTFVPRPWQINHLTLPQFESTYREEISAIYNRFFRDNGKIDCTYSQWVNYCYSHSTKVKPRFPLA